MTGVAVRPAAQGPDPSVADLLAAWLPGRRWFPAGGAAGDVRAEPWLAVTFDEAAPAGGHAADVVLLLVRLTGPGLPAGGVVAQVPLVLTAPRDSGPGLIAVVRTATGDVAVHDGGEHPSCWVTLLHAAGAPTGDVPDDALVAGGRAVGGEQSNTSVLLPGVPSPSGAGAVLKVLRTVGPGPHPDVVVPQALTRAGWDGVPRFLGALQVHTPAVAPTAPGAEAVDLGAAGETALAVVSERVPDARDGFVLACEHAARGESFAHLAGGLGRVVAELHTVLRQTMPPGPRLDPAAFVAGLHRRAATAVSEAPALADRAPRITALLGDLERHLPRVHLQTVHGDLHLGQALHGATGWKLLDFEGEPQRPVAERALPDLPLRDVAGMVRSFDYAAAVGGAPAPDAWRDEASHTFVAAYRDAGGSPETDPPTTDLVLRALVLDKALYEVVYESRQRPAWVHIPLAAVDRVLGGAA